MSELDEIFIRVCVCRSFRLSGLNHILQKFPINSEKFTTLKLLELIGKLTSEGYVGSRLGITEYIVNRKKAERVELNDSSPCELHAAWRDWYDDEFGRYHRFEDLSEWLYHEAAYMKKSPEESTSRRERILESLKSEVQIRLWDYYGFVVKEYMIDVTLPHPDFQKAFNTLTTYLKNRQHEDKLKDVTDYIPNLIHRINDLKMFEGILSSLECEAFIKFLESLNT